MQRIIDYLMTERTLTPVIAQRLSKKLSKYDDIKEAFLQWLDNRDFSTANTPEINGYTPVKIHDLAPFLDGAGVYGFMVTLRDNPEEAIKTIQNGFPRK
ncbi:hypothetical protein [Ruminococcus sp.]|uniref:hypothetical protein n=1 Tax=Ruminococcus sp. TaxID=41978 RepID=UPI00386F8A51